MSLSEAWSYADQIFVSKNIHTIFRISAEFEVLLDYNYNNTTAFYKLKTMIMQSIMFSSMIGHIHT